MTSRSERKVFEPEFASSVEIGDMFACEECHEFVSGDQFFCPDCHAGICEGCGIPVAFDDIGDRDFVEPALIWCRACYAHDHGIPSGKLAPTVENLLKELQRAADAKRELKTHEKVLLFALR